MKMRFAVIAAVVFAALPVAAQTSATSPAKQTPKPATTPAQPAASQPPDPAKAAAVKRLMEVTGSSTLGDEVGKFLTTQVHDGAANGIKPDDRLQKFMSTFNKEFSARYKPAEVNEAAVAIYAKALSLEDIQAITTFYESPVGKRMVQALPAIVRESQGVGMQIGQNAAIGALRAMATEYPELQEMLPPPGAAPGAGPVTPQLAPTAPTGATH